MQNLSWLLLGNYSFFIFSFCKKKNTAYNKTFFQTLIITRTFYKSICRWIKILQIKVKGLNLKKWIVQVPINRIWPIVLINETVFPFVNICRVYKIKLVPKYMCINKYRKRVGPVL